MQASDLRMEDHVLDYLGLPAAVTDLKVLGVQLNFLHMVHSEEDCSEVRPSQELPEGCPIHA